MNQGKLEVVKQEMARVNVDILGISELTWTGVGCHFLLQCMKVKSESEVAQSCLTPSDPMDCSLPGPSIHGIFQARVLEWVAIAFRNGQTGDGKSECRHSRNQRTDVDWNG